jgi:hypothetical protein
MKAIAMGNHLVEADWERKIWYLRGGWYPTSVRFIASIVPTVNEVSICGTPKSIVYYKRKAQ